MTRLRYFCLTAKVIVGLSFGLSLVGGCASARPTDKSFWAAAPVPWTAKSHDSSDDPDHTNSGSEPSVAANVAEKIELQADRHATTTSTDKKPKKAAAKSNSNRPGQAETPFPANTVKFDGAESDKSNSEYLSETDRSDSSLDRLNAALTDDVLQSNSLPQRSLTGLDERIRVESMLARAKQLLELGQLEKARQTAQLAQELGDQAQLDYSPDEERPIDLVHRIESQLDDGRLSINPPPGPAITDSPLRTSASESPDIAASTGKTSGAATKDGLGLSRIRRDLSTFFRRDKKAASPESDLAPHETSVSKKPISAPADDIQGQDRQANRSSKSGARDAFVMANRSVSLGPPEDATGSLKALESDEPGDRANEVNLIHAESPSPPDVESDEDLSQIPNTIAVMNESPRTTIDSNDSNSPPEFDTSEPEGSFNDIKPQLNDRRRSDEVMPVETIRESDWTLVYCVFGVCSLLALRCYRRGAT